MGHVYATSQDEFSKSAKWFCVAKQMVEVSKNM